LSACLQTDVNSSGGSAGRVAFAMTNLTGMVAKLLLRQVSLASVRGRCCSPGVGSPLRGAMRKTWYGKLLKPACIATATARILSARTL
jgi:hypothetical protein